VIRRYPEDFPEGVMEKPANDRDYADILIEDLQYPADRDKKRYDKYCRAFSLYFKGGKTVTETARLMHGSGERTYFTPGSGMRTLRGNHREAGVPSASEEYLRFRQEPRKTYEAYAAEMAFNEDGPVFSGHDAVHIRSFSRNAENPLLDQKY
jgi:hypothetical protein